MKSFAKYWIIYSKSLKNSTFYPWRALSSVLILLARLVITLSIYKIIYQNINGTSINGLTYQGAVWSIGIYFLLLGIPTRRICKVMAQDIRSGNIELKINKPVNYIYFKISEFLGLISLDVVVSFIATLVILIFSVGIPNIDYSFIWFCEVVWLFVAGIVLSLAISIAIGLLAFWMENITPVYWVVDKGLLIFGGAYVPIIFFPPIMKTLAEVLPFAAPVFVNQSFYVNFASSALQLIAIQLVWIIILILFIYWLYAKALKHLSVNGG